MFVLQKDPAWIWPVKARYPTDDGHKEGEFRARFRQLTQAQIDAAQTAADPIRAMMTDAVVELLDLEDEAGQVLPHTPELLAAVLAVPYLKHGISTAYIEAVNGFPTKN
jgi:hypothetical protein